MEAESAILWLKNNWVATLLVLSLLLLVGAPILKRWFAVTGYVAEHPVIHEKTDQKIDRLVETVSEITVTMHTLLTRLESTPVVSGASPLGLTEYGKKLAEDLGARAIIQRHLDQIDRMSESQDITNAYKLQTFCFSQLDWSSVLTEEELDLIDRIAYDEGTDRINVLAVLAIEARDALLARRGWVKGEPDRG